MEGGKQSGSSLASDLFGRMEGGKQSGSSLASDLFGAKDSSAAASSSGVFGSIFAPPPKVSQSSENEKKNSYGNPVWGEKNGVSDGEGQSESTTSKSYYPEEKVQPFHYSSSIYYGGQDVYSRPETAQNPGLTTFNKDGGEDDSDTASRGNWWQGSLYY